MMTKHKNNLLLIGAIAAFTICYKLAIQKTLGLQNKHAQLVQSSVIYEQGPQKLKLLKQKVMYYDSILHKHQLNGSSVQNNLLTMINSYAHVNNIQVIDFSEPHQYDDQEMKLNTYQFSLKGGYNSIIALIYILEQDTKLGEVINLKFVRKENLRTRKRTLEVDVLLRSFG